MSQQSKRGGARAASMTPNFRLQPRRSGAVRSRSATLAKLDLDSAFFWLLLVFLITVFTFLSLRERHVELDPRQVAEYERRTQLLANSTIYIVEVGKPEGLLSTLSPTDWARISSEIDYVSFIFDDPLSLTDEWVAAAETALGQHAKRVRCGIGMALFPCGCLVPNAYFGRVAQRLGGFECILLPGWVLAHEDVHWLQAAEKTSDSCKRREAMLAARMTARYRNELAAIHSTLETLKWELEAAQQNDSREDTGGGRVSALVKEALEQVGVPAKSGEDDKS